MTPATVTRASRGFVAFALAAVMALPVVPNEPPAASLLVWSGLGAVVAGLVTRHRAAIDVGLLLLLVRYAAMLAFASAVDPWVWARAAVTVALIDLAHGSLEAAEPGDPQRMRWVRTLVFGSIGAISAGVVMLATAAAPGGLVVRIVALGALATSLSLLVVLLLRRVEAP